VFRWERGERRRSAGENRKRKRPRRSAAATFRRGRAGGNTASGFLEAEELFGGEECEGG